MSGFVLQGHMCFKCYCLLRTLFIMETVIVIDSSSSSSNNMTTSCSPSGSSGVLRHTNYCDRARVSVSASAGERPAPERAAGPDQELDQAARYCLKRGHSP